MGITGYTAMTAAEFHSARVLPSHFAWMACHFSCYGTGLSNLPQQLPDGAMVIVNDRTPVHGHDPKIITAQLQALFEAQKPACFLLDLQRPDNPETKQIAQAIVAALPCPVGVSSLYAEDLDCPVFLPPPAIDCPFKDHLLPWTGRDIWLEVAEDTQTATVTEQGCTFSPGAPSPAEGDLLLDEEVFCHYRSETAENALRVYLWRDKEALHKMLLSANDFGVTLAVGLYQQLGADFF